MTARLDHHVASGTFSLDGQTFDVENNVWVLGDDRECVVVDAPHDVEAIVAAVGGRRLVAVVATHAHDDHVREAPAVAALLGAPVLLHPADRPVWELTHAVSSAVSSTTTDLTDGQVLTVGGTDVHVLHTPGHTPGSVCLHVPELGIVLTGDTLFRGGPGATGRSFSDFPTIVESIRTRLLTLPPGTRVLPGHGDATTIGEEAPHLPEWVARGH